MRSAAGVVLSLNASRVSSGAMCWYAWLKWCGEQRHGRCVWVWVWVCDCV
jgi:hypothetical protein